jgi:hypothetical protein
MFHENIAREKYSTSHYALRLITPVQTSPTRYTSVEHTAFTTSTSGVILSYTELVVRTFGIIVLMIMRCILDVA